VYVILDDNNVPEYALWFYDRIEFTNGEKTVHMCELYDKESVYTYRKDGSWIKIDEIPHLFSGVPLFIIENNSERLGDFEKAVELINAYDKALSDVSSEMEQLRLAYAIIKGARLDDETVEKMKQTGILPIDKDGSFEFVEKQLDSESIKLLLSEIRRNIFLFCKSVDFSEVLAGDIRVLGWQTKLMPLENKAKIAERKMISALRYQYDLLTQYWAQFDGVSIDVNDMNWIFTRNIPKDIEGEARSLQMLTGVVDRETALSLMSFIDNPKEVIERMEAEMPPVNLDEVRNE
jgi:SPP1 family phage portal protein